MATKIPKTKIIWVGLVEVSPLFDSQISSDVTGAFVQVVTWASDLTEFRAKANVLMDHLHLRVDSIEGAKPLPDWGSVDSDSGIARLASEAEGNEHAILYGTFHTWGQRAVQ